MKIEWQRAAAYVIAFDAKHRVLLTRFEVSGHPRSGSWTLLGGGMEWGEQAHQTAARELREETGLEADIGSLLGAQSEWFHADVSAHKQPGHALRLVFEVHRCRGKLKEEFSDDDTIAAAAWFTLEDVFQLKRVELVDFGIGLFLDRNGQAGLSQR